MLNQNKESSNYLSRRSWLRTALAGVPVALTLGDASRLLGAPRQSEDSRGSKVLKRLRGPMASITIPYNRDYSIDHGSLRAWVDFVCEGGAPILFLTYGDSELYNLNDDEIEAVMKTVAAQAKGRSLVVGGTPHGWTGETVDFVNRLEDCGVDAANVHLYSQNPGEIERALREVAEKTRLPLLAYESKYSLDLVRRIAKIPGFVGMKCHAELYGYYDFIRETKNDGFGVLSAGQMKHFLFGYLVGSPAYLCPLTPFAPQIGMQFYEALEAGSIDQARRFIFEYEEPLLKLTIPLGYPHAYKSALYLAGLYRTNLLRPPKATNSESSLGPLRAFLEEKQLIGNG